MQSHNQNDIVEDTKALWAEAKMLYTEPKRVCREAGWGILIPIGMLVGLVLLVAQALSQ